MTKRFFFTVAFSAIAITMGFSAAWAQTGEVKAVTDLLTREALAVEKADLAALRQNLGEQ